MLDVYFPRTFVEFLLSVHECSVEVDGQVLGGRLLDKEGELRAASVHELTHEAYRGDNTVYDDKLKHFSMTILCFVILLRSTSMAGTLYEADHTRTQRIK